MDFFFIVYLEDIFIFSKTLDDNIIHIHRVFEKLREENFLINLKEVWFCEEGANVFRIFSFSGRGWSLG